MIKSQLRKARIQFVICMLVVCSTFLPLLVINSIPVSPANDLAKHLAYILNFKDAFFDWQILPRMQSQIGIVPDHHVFQFYGIFMGYSSLPFLVIGFSPLSSVCISLIIWRSIAMFCLLRVGRLLGASISTAILGASVYSFSPYILSNVLGRFAIPEAFAHTIFPVLIYGAVRFSQKRDYFSLLLTAIFALFLAFTHPIFLLYGTIFWILFSMLIFERLNDFIIILMCFGLGVLTACIQWGPAIFYMDRLISNFTTISPFTQRGLTSLSGGFGLPRPLSEVDGVRLFLTPGILTFPVVLFLLKNITFRYAKATVICVLTAMLISYSPIDFWSILPRVSWSIQFPYRALFFVTVFTALGAFICFRNMPWKFNAIGWSLIASQAMFVVYFSFYKEMLNKSEEINLQSSFTNIDYEMFGNDEDRKYLPFRSSDKWLVPPSQQIVNEYRYPLSIVSADGRLKADNRILFSPPRVPNLYFSIYLNAQQGPGEVWLAKSDTSLLPIDGVRKFELGYTQLKFRVPANENDLTLQCRTFAGNVCDEVFLIMLHFTPAGGIVVNKSKILTATELYIRGVTSFSEGFAELWIADPENPDVPLTGKVTVPAGDFGAVVGLPEENGAYILMSSRFLIPRALDSRNTDDRLLTLRVDEFAFYNSLIGKPIFAKQIFRKGYKRIYSWDKGIEPPNDLRHIVLPISYSPMLEIRQENEIVEFDRDVSGLTSIVSKSNADIIVAYKHPRLFVIVSFVGMTGIFILFIMALLEFKQKCFDKKYKYLSSSFIFKITLHMLHRMNNVRLRG